MTIQPFDFSLNLLRALLWQHNDAARLESLLNSKQGWYETEQAGFWEDWVTDVFDLATANDFGMSVWAIILGVPLAVSSGGDDPDKPIWGFAPDDENFGNGNFAGWVNLPLTAEQRRLILRLRYFQLVTRGAVPEINAFLAQVFADLGTVYVTDGLNMNARYVFGFPLPTDLEEVLASYDLLPRPAGVRIDYVVLEDADGWGFGRYHFNFENGNFYHG